MIRNADAQWQSYTRKITRKLDLYDAPFADDLPYIGTLSHRSDYVPSNKFYAALSSWLRDVNQERIFFFLTEGTKGEPNAFEIGLEDLTWESISEINHGFSSLYLGYDLDWAIFINDEGEIQVAGNHYLFQALETNTQEDVVNG